MESRYCKESIALYTRGDLRKNDKMIPTLFQERNWQWIDPFRKLENFWLLKTSTLLRLLPALWRWKRHALLCQRGIIMSEPSDETNWKPLWKAPSCVWVISWRTGCIIMVTMLLDIRNPLYYARRVHVRKKKEFLLCVFTYSFQLLSCGCLNGFAGARNVSGESWLWYQDWHLPGRFPGAEG